ncbi:RNA ligase family protein [Paracoccus litorisediminis]|uniref:RNA ligase family protein n=1 Tax=Paracoccus litorisediminis TaxID=2006130 RepID=UPI003733366C
MDLEIIKYPRTPHLEGSKLQPGDCAHDQASIAAVLAAFPGARWVNEEKLDGANCAISFDKDLNLRLQSRGHLLLGGAREGQFNLLKEWASYHEAALLERLEDRYIVYGEWCFARHTQFYDLLPHYFHEFDVWDRRNSEFLSTERRHNLFADSPVVAVPVLDEVAPRNRKDLATRVCSSRYRSENWRDNLALAAERAGLDPQRVLAESGAERPDADLAEGIYVKVENAQQVLARFKFVRPGFIQTILESGQHWSARPIIRNRLVDGVDLFLAEEISHRP